MFLRILWIVCVAAFLGVGCSKDDVDSSYVFKTDNLKVIVTDKDGKTLDQNQKFLHALKTEEFTGEFEFSAESRADNDKLALEKFTEKSKSLKNLDLDAIFELKAGESVDINFDYVISRGKDELQKDKISLQASYSPPAE